jgi:hypothetical protein
LLCFCWWWRLTAWRTISFATSAFENPASIMACRMGTPVVFWGIRMADSIFFWCVALFFEMFGSGMYTVEMDSKKKKMKSGTFTCCALGGLWCNFGRQDDVG